MLLQQGNVLLREDADGLVVPEGGLNLADVSLAEQKHAQTGLTDAAADGKGQLAV